ncbi:MAG: succinate dehydrogenase cytochrome b subunit [Ignavibacteriales bacterium]|nr:succinate dehydrogenase cytochrome b subunit [Ignavibacteriales bacterium]
MNKLSNFYDSSVGKKVLMSLTGIFLCLFLVEHLLGNLLLFAGAETYDTYSEFLAHNVYLFIVMRFIELGLFASLFLHAFLGVLLWFKNRATRPQKYEKKKAPEDTLLASRITMITGSIVFIFLVIHLRTFFVPTRFGTEKFSPYQVVADAFQSAPYSFFYIIALIFLAYHLRHGFQSAFQTLGLRTKSYIKLLDAIAVIFWLLIPLGFATMPIYFLWFHN